ncbi:unnamed protein product [Acanthoscelides obtectus]|uniref:Uncharacterized protein n=1 Tax=Acanthoscelides obtectus TaxID=200917 RepID=A0A9P0M021_ACAOB|nr:unnamed protein product [Acanthoscelides obtectus]CAK1647743.1 hypothetical protein AOBTE_LOCUS15377 [Acanthoscelides obtectus]
MMRYEEENEKLADKSACAGVRADLKMCLLESDCCKVVSATWPDVYLLLFLITMNRMSKFESPSCYLAFYPVFIPPQSLPYFTNIKTLIPIELYFRKNEPQGNV